MRDSARSAFGVGGRGAIMYEPAAIHILADGEVTVPLEITQREMNGIYLLALRGRLVLGEESGGFRTTVDNLLSSGATRIVVNLEHVNYVDSAGLGALIEAHRKTKAQGGRLKLSNLGPNFKQALELARLLTIFDTCPTEAAAVAGF
jgi:anti-sigma B factor antagonist